MTSSIRYNFYPTILNEYVRYLKNPNSETFRQLINRINRVPILDDTLREKFAKGISFEAAVLKNKPHDFTQQLVDKAKELLPNKWKSQQLVELIHGPIRFYGYLDVIGDQRVIDIKTTQTYLPGKHETNFQNLYAYALREKGIKTMEYFICDFHQIYVERYDVSTYPFSHLLEKMESFTQFIEENKGQITDAKIRVETKNSSQMTLF